jgi:hypothetical protein
LCSRDPTNLSLERMLEKVEAVVKEKKEKALAEHVALPS